MKKSYVEQRSLDELQEHYSEADRDDTGAAMVEYGLLVAFIAIIALVGVKALGTNVLGLFNGVSF